MYNVYWENIYFVWYSLFIYIEIVQIQVYMSN